jgi:GNAT superfamily N-acetyltransferase
MRVEEAVGDGLHARAAVVSDIRAIRDLERRAGAPFRDIGLDVVADDEPPAVDVLTGAVRSGDVLVVEDHSSTEALERGPIAWIWLSTADDDLLVEQVSVDPLYRGRRIGCALIGKAGDRARAQGLPGIVLTTFRDVPWNGPLYHRLGFRTLQDAEIGPELRAVRRTETEAGLDVLPRVCLRRQIRA